jgi:hypothetical protein
MHQMLVMLFIILTVRPCPYDGELAKLFTQRDTAKGHECGYSHDHYSEADKKHYLHVFWVKCE